MMTSSNGNIFRVTGHLCGEFIGLQWIPHTQRPVTRSFDVYFDLRLNKRLCKQSWGWWLETLPCPLWCHSNEITKLILMVSCQKGPTRNAYAWQIGPFWQDTLDIWEDKILPRHNDVMSRNPNTYNNGKHVQLNCIAQVLYHLIQHAKHW